MYIVIYSQRGCIFCLIYRGQHQIGLPIWQQPGQASCATDPSYFPLQILHSAQGCWPSSLFTCFQIQGGKVNIKQTCALLKWLKDAIRSGVGGGWGGVGGGGFLPLRLVCLSLVLLCRPLTSHSNLQSHPNPNGAASLELAPLPGLGCFVLNHLSVWFSDMEVSLIIWNK